MRSPISVAAALSLLVRVHVPVGARRRTPTGDRAVGPTPYDLRLEVGGSKVACEICRALIMDLAIRLQHVARDHHLHHFARALGDAIAPLLPPHLLDRQVGGEGDTAVDLHALIGGPERHLVSVILADIAVLTRVLAGIEAARSLI